VLGEDDPAELEDDPEGHAAVASEHERDHERAHEREEPAVRNAFAAMDGEASPTAEPAPAATSDTPAE
jgi:hypothetical protein